ncbi:NUDIX domain-containing protein [Halolamina sp. CBA1230]|uniref:NUDIX domain-containing protein n=1 Tax=Halolamina sp. CBA1230 TaxID=1853690 RepID=UPI0020D081B7|nr:NUDIX domain-containing protein [Halolamina sp. CBA1230]
MVLIAVEGEWFVSGGTVLNSEARTEAVHRVIEEELGVSVTIDYCFGPYEYFYDPLEIEGIDSKYYIVTVYRCRLDHETPLRNSEKV